VGGNSLDEYRKNFIKRREVGENTQQARGKKEGFPGRDICECRFFLETHSNSYFPRTWGKSKARGVSKILQIKRRSQDDD